MLQVLDTLRKGFIFQICLAKLGQYLCAFVIVLAVSLLLDVVCLLKSQTGISQLPRFLHAAGK